MARRILLSLLLAVIGVLGLSAVTPASAHTGLLSSDPRDGAQLAAPPAQVSFVFDEELLPDFANFSVTSAAGDPISIVGIRIDGAAAVLPWPSDAPGGTYTVAYRVVSQDGHPVSGSITFGYVSESPTPEPTSSSPAPTSSSASPTVSPTSASPAPAPTDSPTPTQSPTTTPSPSPSPDVNPVSSTTSIGWIIAAAAVVILAIIAIVALVMRRR